MPRIPSSSRSVAPPQSSGSKPSAVSSDSKRSIPATRTKSPASSTSSAGPAHVKRPPNCFILFRIRMCQIMSAQDPEWHLLSQAQKSYFIRDLWKDAAPELKAMFQQRAKVVAEEHKRAQEDALLLVQAEELIEEAKRVMEGASQDAATITAMTASTSLDVPSTSYNSSQDGVDLPGHFYQPPTEEDPYGFLSESTTLWTSADWNDGMFFDGGMYADAPAYPYPSVPPYTGLLFAPVDSRVSGPLDSYGLGFEDQGGEQYQ